MTKALEAERTEHKATKAKASERRVAFATALGLPDTSNDDAIMARLGTFAQTDAVAAVERERDDARAKLADMESRWAGEKIDAAIQSALSKSGMDARNHEDAANILRPLLAMKDGEVVTKDGTANIKAEDGEAMERFVWVDREGPAWMRGGTYMVTRRIRMLLEIWDRSSLEDQEQTIGRDKYHGAPLGGKEEFEPLEGSITLGLLHTAERRLSHRLGDSSGTCGAATQRRRRMHRLSADGAR